MPRALGSRVGRRIAVLFVLCALLPMLVLTLLGYRQVRQQLLADADGQLRQAAKTVGMGLGDRLRSARDLLTDLAGNGGSIPSADLDRRSREAFASLALAGPGARVIWGAAPPADTSIRSSRVRLQVDGRDTVTTWLAVPVPGRDAWLWGALHNSFLFDGARERAVVGTSETALCVREMHLRRIVYCPADASADVSVRAEWNLFLGYDYGAPSWQVEVRRPRGDVLAPISDFRRTLVASLIAVAGFVVLLTNVQVRRTLRPLHALRDGTARLARRDFSAPVAVRSGDEFEDLAVSFNGMAGELDEQFNANAGLITRLNDLSYGALAALARTIDASSSWTAGHSERVTSLSMRMAEHLQLDEAHTDALRRGGLLHDIGKIGIPPNILDKAGPLETGELERIREHPLVGARILAPIAAFADAIPVVRSHHERYDGTGYPDGLKGTGIPRLARLLAVADVYDALVSSRPYRAGWAMESALDTIREGIGTHFDSEMVAVFLAVISHEGDKARFSLVLEQAS